MLPAMSRPGPSGPPACAVSPRAPAAAPVRQRGALYCGAWRPTLVSTGAGDDMEALLERLPEHLEDMTPARREFVQEEHPMMRPRPLAWHRHLAAAPQPRWDAAGRDMAGW
jgi:hypothetical protein